MLSYIYLFFKSFVFAFLLNDYLQQKYPEKYNEVLITTSLKAIYLFSKTQIIINRTNRYIVNSFNQFMIKNPKINIFVETCINYYNHFTNKPTTQHDIDIEFISNGKIIHALPSYNFLNLSIDDIKFQIPITYDFIIFSDYNLTKKNTFINKKIQKSIENKNFNYELSDISFILSEIIIGDKKIKVDFKTEFYNYYIVNNIFNDKFILYFLNRHYSYEIKEIPLETLKQFKFKIIDNNVDTKDYDNSVNIQIQKDGYITIE
jgi:hypothetical protein